MGTYHLTTDPLGFFSDSLKIPARMRIQALNPVGFSQQKKNPGLESGWNFSSGKESGQIRLIFPPFLMIFDIRKKDQNIKQILAKKTNF